MSNQELQELLIKKILKTDDTLLLKDATRLLDIAIDAATMYEFSASEIYDIEEARQQVKKWR